MKQHTKKFCTSTGCNYLSKVWRSESDVSRGHQLPLCPKAWFPYDCLDRPSGLKNCLDDRDDHMETLELSSIRTTVQILKRLYGNALS